MMFASIMVPVIRARTVVTALAHFRVGTDDELRE